MAYTGTGTLGHVYTAKGPLAGTQFQAIGTGSGLTGLVTANTPAAFTGNPVTQYGVVIAGASNAVSSLAPSATAGVPLISQGAAANPSYGTAVVAGGGTGATSLTAYAVVCGGTTSTGAVQSIASVGTSGQLLTSNGASALPTFQAAPASGTIWSVVTIDATIVSGSGYICNKGSTLVLTLPATSAVSDFFEVTGINMATGWKIAQNANQQIFFGTVNTTVGVGGSMTSAATRDTVRLVCVVAGASSAWNVVSSVGNITYV